MSSSPQSKPIVNQSRLMIDGHSGKVSVCDPVGPHISAVPLYCLAVTPPGALFMCVTLVRGNGGSVTQFTVTIHHAKDFAVLLSHILILRSILGSQEIRLESSRMVGGSGVIFLTVYG